MDPMNSHGFLFGRFDPRGPLAFKIEMRQQKPQEEEIPIPAMAALKLPGKHRPWWHQHYDLPTWGQIKPLLIEVKIWSLNRKYLGVLNTFSWQCFCLPVPPPFEP